MSSTPDPLPDAFNPLHNGSGAAFSNAFAALLVPAVIGLALSAALLRRRPTGDKADIRSTWTHDCQVPWCPEFETQLTTEKGAICND